MLYSGKMEYLEVTFCFNVNIHAHAGMQLVLSNMGILCAILL